MLPRFGEHIHQLLSLRCGQTTLDNNTAPFPVCEVSKLLAADPPLASGTTVRNQAYERGSTLLLLWAAGSAAPNLFNLDYAKELETFRPYYHPAGQLAI